jgi:hypothetical protein
MARIIIVSLILLSGLAWFIFGNKPIISFYNKILSTVEQSKSEEDKSEGIKEIVEGIREEIKKEVKEEVKKEIERGAKKEVKKEAKKEIKKQVKEVKKEVKKEQIKAKDLFKNLQTSVIKRKPAPVAKKAGPNPPNYSARKPNKNETTVRLYMYEWSLDMMKRTLPAGKIVFEVVNKGRFPHNFNIRDVYNFGTVLPRSTESFVLNLNPGSYTLYSGQQNSSERRLTTTFRVVERQD